jgi:hypothetical protein
MKSTKRINISLCNNTTMGGRAEGVMLKKNSDGVKNRALNFSSHSVSMRPFRAVLKDF